MDKKETKKKQIQKPVLTRSQLDGKDVFTPYKAKKSGKKK